MLKVGYLATGARPRCLRSRCAELWVDLRVPFGSGVHDWPTTQTNMSELRRKPHIYALRPNLHCLGMTVTCGSTFLVPTLNAARWDGSCWADCACDKSYGA